jgi:hypothetical protein
MPLLPMWGRKINIQYIMSHYDALNPRALKTANDDLGFTK